MAWLVFRLQPTIKFGIRNPMAHSLIYRLIGPAL